MTQISNVDIKELVSQYGSPIYVYSQNQIENNYNKIKSAFTKYYPKTKIHFSVKANSNINILEIFKNLDAGTDCSSPIEFKLSKHAGFQNNNILYTGNYESIEDLETVAFENVKLNLDDINSFKRLATINVPELVSFRINPGIGRGGFEGITTAGTDAKFGIPYEKAYEAYKLAKEAGVKRFGIHMMTGSNNLEPHFFGEIVNRLMNIAHDIFSKLDIKPEYVDIGGGYGIPYTNQEEELNIDLTAKIVTDIFKEQCLKFNFGEPELILEPGRYLVANAGYLITQVTGIKDSYKKFVGVNAGMNFLIRPAMYGAFHRAEVYGKSNLTTHINLCGQICENSDIFAKNLEFPEVEVGDIVTFRDVGAYGYVMASNYNNRLKPAEILVNDNKHKLIRRKETFEDYFNLYQ
ncbi:MAG: diaminopimelate decarboxylase [Candidatus Kapabacteria bacterium]|nr:diaminopimelate decarboxylase [Candidatus Kapabacteria bacterium]